MSASPPAARAFPLAKADQCVKCGLCLPHCPTYRLTQNEGDSPRGRIMLMQGLATGMVGAEPALLAHLDGCLTCRACEAVCPAEVPYGTLIDSVREVLQEIHPGRSRVPRAMAMILVNKPLRFLAAGLLWLYQRLGIQWLIRTSRVLGRGQLARLESLLPTIYLPMLPAEAALAAESFRPHQALRATFSRKEKGTTLTSPSGRGRAEGAGEGAPETVALFANCTSPLVEPEALKAAVRLLARVGCNVTVPGGQTCCGALHQHAGLAHGARGCAQKNLRAFADADAVIGIASGCTAQLVDYGEMLASEPADAFARKSVDLHGFLAKHPQRDRLRFKALPARVLLHSPCTLRNVLKDAAAVRGLLAMVPELDVRSLEGGCCGAAGSYFVTQPDMADRLLEPMLERIRREAPGYVLSSNVGCSMHLAAGLRRAGLTIPVWHPARLLAQQLDG